MPPKAKHIEWEIDNNGCYNCSSHSKDYKGYGRITKNYKTIMLHRHIYEECFGEIPDGMVVLHKCDNPSCINPEHLELGTQKDNMVDKSKKNRYGKSAKLTPEQVVSIRNSDKSNSKLAIIYGVDNSTISNIKLRKKWKHIT